MNTKLIKLACIALTGSGAAWIATAGNAAVLVPTATVDDAATVYKAKCAMCHTPKAEKFYDPAKGEDDHVQIVLKGKKGEKPPYMPGFAEKGMKEDEAKALVQYMQTLRQPK